MRKIFPSLFFRRGFSLTELLVSIIIATVLMLTVGVISSISLSSHNKVRKESELLADLAYTIKLMQNRVREASALIEGNVSTDPTLWASEQLIVQNNGSNDEVFALYNFTPPPTGTVELVRVPFTIPPTGTFSATVNRTFVEANKEVLLSITTDGTNNIINLDVCLDVDEATTSPECPTEEAGTALGAYLDLFGFKNKIPFDIKTKIRKRAL